MRCTKCGTDNAADSRFCNQCATPLSRACPTCAHLNAPDAKFCAACADPLTSDVSKATAHATSTSLVRVASEPAGPDVADGERKTVTALFADIKGSTQLEQDLDPEEARDIIDPALKLMIDAAHRYDGYVVQSTGDGIFALFGAPVAHEDHPQRALYAALRMQEELKHYSSGLREAGNLPLEARVGVNTGEVVVRSITTGEGHTEYTPIGHTTNLASRMQTLAPVGSIAVAESTRKLCEGYFVLKPLGPIKVKGVSEPVNVYEVMGVGPLRTRLQRSAGHGLTKFIGRECEIEALAHAAEQAKAGRGQIVAAVGDPGVGKSRLLYEFIAASGAGWTILEANAISHGKTAPYMPAIGLLKEYFKMTGYHVEGEPRDQVVQRVISLDRSLEEILPFLLDLLGLAGADRPMPAMNPQLKQRRTLDAILRLILRESINQPVMLIVEDLQWIDQQTHALLNLLVDSIAASRVLMLVNYRPEYINPWGNISYHLQIRLNPLAADSAERMLDELLGEARELAPLKRVMIDRTEGNPFFMEEMAQALSDQGVLDHGRRADRSAIKLPVTVQGVLAARIDSLSTADKELLQTLAVVGRSFPLSLIEAATDKPRDEIEAALSRLQTSEFIFEQAGGVEYTFKHALTQEVAYNSVLIQRRKILHQRIASVIEQLFAGKIDDHLAELADHYRRAENPPKAIHYLVRAAYGALAHSAFDESIAGLRAGLEMLERIPAGREHMRYEAALRIALANALGGRDPASPEVEAALLRARELGEVLDPIQAFQVQGGLHELYKFRGDVRRARDLGKELVATAERVGWPTLLMQIHAGFAQTLYFCGDLDAAREHLELAAVEFEKSDARPDPGGFLETIGRPALVRCLLGYPDRAVEASNRAIALAESNGDPLPRTLTQVFAAQLYYLIRDAHRAAQHSELAVRLASDLLGSLTVGGYGAVCKGWSTVSLGNIDEGLAEIRRATEQLDLAGATMRNTTSPALVECYWRAGKIDEGLELVSNRLKEAEQTGEQLCVAELNRLKGELLLMRGAADAPEAEAAFRRAIGTARAQGARWWELRATISLARLRRDQGKRAEARDLLAPIYGWFTEGFDTADLKDAQTLLAELGS